MRLSRKLTICAFCLAGGIALPIMLAAEPPLKPAGSKQSATSSTQPDQSAIKDAEAAQKTVQEKEATLIKLLQEISEATKDVEPGNFLKEKRALDSFRKVIPLLKERATWLLDKQQEFGKHIQLYQAALEKMPRAFMRASEAYSKYAADEGDLFFKEQYLEMSARSKKLAATMEARAKQVSGAEAEVAQKLRFVERSVVFLNRLDEFLAIYNPASGRSADVDAYLRQLDSYITHFNETISSFRQLSEKIQSSPARQ
jgi:hypothetical protein